ncbi:pyridoxamine 5'-phosphate oxidase family protein [Desulfovibrio sp.]|uniref:pyridoxamine 5'-phosphate oxidase family protein n=1 Tax=Desulfovibrio sp. TaxID=885 RepID=UPI0023C4099F|nr:pyridoxamine 5'-phosphate oxidase family protein [Desulfovibrio sp.]MDE7241489.1 pyridoxamine 5'-phosphate oxidase family protein [Desulfovibrio sp.]
MIRQLRRKRQALSREACIALLQRATSGVLALRDAGPWPYAVPLSYVYHQEKLYFHSATRGHKLDALRENPGASFCVIGEDRVMPGELTTCFRSVIAFGTVGVVEDAAEKRQAMRRLAMKYAPDVGAERVEAEIAREWKRLCVLAFSIEYLSGKQAIELVARCGREGVS